MEGLKEIAFIVLTVAASCCVACPDVCGSVKTVCHFNRRTNQDIQCRYIACPPGYEVKRCTGHCDQDLCMKCEDGYFQPENATSETWEQTRCIPNIRCREDLESDPNNPNHCRCALSKGYYGSDPTNCQWKGPCPSGTELRKSGKCLTCQPGFFKKTAGLELCATQMHCASLGMKILSAGTATADYECYFVIHSSEHTKTTAKRGPALTNSSTVPNESHSLHLKIIIPAVFGAGALIFMLFVIKGYWKRIQNFMHGLNSDSTSTINGFDNEGQTTVGCKTPPLNTVAVAIDSEQVSLLDEGSKRPSMSDSSHSTSTGSTSLALCDDASQDAIHDNNDLLSNDSSELGSPEVDDDLVKAKESVQGQVQSQEAMTEEFAPNETDMEIISEDQDSQTIGRNISPSAEAAPTVARIQEPRMDAKRPLLAVKPQPRPDWTNQCDSATSHDIHQLSGFETTYSSEYNFSTDRSYSPHDPDVFAERSYDESNFEDDSDQTSFKTIYGTDRADIDDNVPYLP